MYDFEGEGFVRYRVALKAVEERLEPLTVEMDVLQAAERNLAIVLGRYALAVTGLSEHVVEAGFVDGRVRFVVDKAEAKSTSTKEDIVLSGLRFNAKGSLCKMWRIEAPFRFVKDCGKWDGKSKQVVGT